MDVRALVVLLLGAVAHCAPRCDISLNLGCDEIYTNLSRISGVYTIYPLLTPVQVYCDMDNDGGKWTVIQRRMDGSLNFYLPWVNYTAGFGDAFGEYWLGLDTIHILTDKRKHQLRVDMEDFTGKKVFAQYSSFHVGPESDGYRLRVGGFKNGGAGDSLRLHNGQRFSTFDKDQDAWRNNCAATYLGAFWYSKCHHTNLNGIYLWGPSAYKTQSVQWSTWKDYPYSLKRVEMKIRPVS